MSMANAIGKSARQTRNRPPFECIASVLQGGGALGAYQRSVCEALAEAAVEPDWTAGISIGAFNVAIIAGIRRRCASKSYGNSGGSSPASMDNRRSPPLGR